MTVETLLATWPKEKELTINHMWLPAHHYVWNEKNENWEYWDGDCWVSPFGNEQNGDPDFDPNELELDEEYSFQGTVDEFDRDGLGWLLSEEVYQLHNGVYEVRRKAYA